MPVRSPLTAASRQCSRRPARHVVVHSQFFSDCISAVNYVFLARHFCGYKTKLQPQKALQADSEGAFFSSESAEKKRTGWVGQSVSSMNRTKANPSGWVGQSVSSMNRTKTNPSGCVGQSVPSIQHRCSRHAGTVAALHGKAMTFASACPPCRHPFAEFLRQRFCR